MNNRILLIANEYTTILQFRKEVICAFIDSGFEVGVALPSSEYDNEIMKLGCKVFNAHMERHGINPFKDLKFQSKLQRIIKLFNPFVCLTYTIKPNIYGGIASKKEKIPFIANVTGLGESITKKGIIRSISLFLYKRSLKHSYWTFFQNKSNMDFMISKKVVRGNCCSLLPGSGVNLSLHPYERYPNNKQTTFITIGRMIKSKGIGELLDAIEIIKNEGHDAKFVLIGDSHGEYENDILEMNKNNFIKYYPYQKNVHNFIKEADCIIHPSYHEGMSNVLLEAGATGRPILASNIPGCKEIVDEGINGFLFEPKSTDSIVSSIKLFLSKSQSDREEMGYRSYLKIMHNYDRSIIINKYLEKINQLLKEKE